LQIHRQIYCSLYLKFLEHHYVPKLFITALTMAF